MVTTETDVASLRKQLAGTAPGQSEPLQQHELKQKIFLPLVGATVFVKIALATLSTQHFHSRWAARKISICSSWG
ncbi:putative lipoprotein [Escherichia coli]|uniref:Putative lipoprotein n=1 Tax=Escherichia coli TaxID=562 RepID=A0A485JGQ8_ECOLX|nr:putative lipoprotein [Escherichia coli]